MVSEKHVIGASARMDNRTRVDGPGCCTLNTGDGIERGAKWRTGARLTHVERELEHHRAGGVGGCEEKRTLNERLDMRDRESGKV